MFEYFQLGGRVQAQTQSLIDESVCLAVGILATNPLTHTLTHSFAGRSEYVFTQLASSFCSPSVPTIKTEPHDDYDAPLLCSQHGPGLPLHPKPYFPSQVMTPLMTPDLRPCVVGGGYAAHQQRFPAKPPSLPSSSSPSTSPKLHDLSPPPFSKCLPAGPAVQHLSTQSPIPHVSIIQETPGRYQTPNLYPPSSSSSSPVSQPSTPGTGPEAPFSPSHCMTQPVSGGSSPGTQQHPKVPERGRPSVQEDGSPPPTMAVSIKQEPQELDQMYLDDGA